MGAHEATSSVINKLASQSSIKNKKAWILGWLPIVIGLAAWLFNPPEWLEFIKAFGFFAAIAISVAVHEIAHFVAGSILELKPWCLRIGHGETVFDKQYKRFRLILKSLPYSGAVYPYLPGTRSKQFLMTLAGPLSNGVLLIVFFGAISGKLEMPAFTEGPMQMFLANAYLFIGSLIPYSRTGPNDATIMIDLLRGTSSTIDAGEYSQSSIHPKGPSWSWMVDQLPADALLAQYRTALSRPNLSTDQRCALLDSFVTYVLMHGSSEFLAEADQHSEELLRLKPDEWTIKGTRGSVLVEKGDIAAGAAMLKDVMANDQNPFDRAISASFLALAELKQNNRTEALRWLAISRESDPNCGSTLRIAALLDSKTPISDA